MAGPCRKIKERKGNMFGLKNTKANRLKVRDQLINSDAQNGWTVHRVKTAPMIVLTKDLYVNGRSQFYLKVYIGTAAKPYAYYRFFTPSERESYAAGIAKNLTERQTKNGGKKFAKAADHYAVRDVLVNSWGYDQTNVDYYEVTRVKGSSVWLRKIAAKSKVTGYMSGRCQPDRGNFIGEEFRKLVDKNGRISAKHGCFSKWDGKADHWTAYH